MKEKYRYVDKLHAKVLRMYEHTVPEDHRSIALLEIDTRVLALNPETVCSMREPTN